MIDKKPARSQIRMGLGFLISLVALVVLIPSIDGEQVLAAMKQVRLIIVLPGLALLLISLLTRAAAWRVLLQEKISLWQSFLLINTGYFVNTVLPFRLGEFGRALLLKSSGFSFWEAFPTILLERLFDFAFALILFFIGLPFVLNFSQEIGFFYLLSGFILLGVVVLILLVKYRAKLINWLEGKNSSQSLLFTRLVNFLQSILSSMAVLSDPGRLARVFLGMFLSWAIALIYQYLLLRAFIPDAKLIWAVFALGAVALGVSIPSSPGNIGLYEASMTLALSAFGVDQSVAFSYALTSHFLSLGVTTLFGSFGLVREGFGLRDVWQFSEQHQKENDL